MDKLNVFGVATLYADELLETCLRLGIDYQAINNLRDVGVNLAHAVEDLNVHSGPCVVAPSSPRARVDAVEEAFQLGVRRFANLVDPSSQVAHNVTLGCGNYINTMSVIGASSRLGCHCNVNRQASIGHHNQIGSFSSIGPGAILCGAVSVSFGALIGAGAVVLPEVRVGANSVVGAGAVVTKDVQEGTIVVGNPALPVGTTAPWTGLGECPIC